MVVVARFGSSCTHAFPIAMSARNSAQGCNSPWSYQLMMNQLPSVHASGDLTLEEASAGSIFCQWQSPLLPGPETSENSRRAVQRIIRQCKLVCSKTSERQKKMKIVRRLLFACHPDNAILMNRDHAVCTVVSQWLQRLRSCSTFC